MRPFILGINGGKKNGRTSTFLRSSLSEAKRLGASIKIIELADFKILPITKVAKNPELDSSLKSSDDTGDILKEVLRADGIIFATPVHWFGPSAEMKIFIDRLTPLENSGFLLEGKVAGFIALGNEAGKVNTLMQLSAVTNHMGMLLSPYSLIYLENKPRPWAKKDLLLLPKNMLKLIDAVKERKLTFGYK